MNQETLNAIGIELKSIKPFEWLCVDSTPNGHIATYVINQRAGDDVDELNLRNGTHICIPL